MYESKKSEIYDMADVPTYEEVTSYRRPTGSKHRLVVLVGELKKLLLPTVDYGLLKKKYIYCSRLKSIYL